MPPDRGAGQPRTKTGGDFIKKFDKNSDGLASRREFLGRDKLFNHLDKNNDGYINEYEASEERKIR